MSISAKSLRAHTLNGIDLRDYTPDLTGVSDNASKVQQWQNDCKANKRVATAPRGVIGLATKVTFKAPTIGAGGALYGAGESIDATPYYTMFKNLAINDGSWMIEVETAANTQEDFGLVKDFRCHANGLNVSLMRVLGVETSPAGFAWSSFTWENIVGFGGLVNFEHYGYGGVIRNVYSRYAAMSAFRAYLCNALVVEGGWYGVANNAAWCFEVFGRASSGYLTESTHGIIFNQPVFQPQDGVLNGNGLRISEGVREVLLSAYFESLMSSSGVGGVALQVGWNKSSHESNAAPTAVVIAGADAPTNDPRFAAMNINLSGSTGGDTNASLSEGARFMFNNVRGVRWGSAGIFGRRAEYTKHSRDIEGVSTTLYTGEKSLSGVGGTTLVNTESAGATVIEVASTTSFGVGQPVFVQLNNISGRGNVHEDVVASIDTGVSITLTGGIPSGRTANAGNLICRNIVGRYFSMSNEDELNRPFEHINLLPPANFLGTVSDASVGGSLRGVKEAYTNFANGRATWETDTTVRRGGRPTLKVTRKGSVVAGAQVARLWFYPWGNEQFLQTGVPIVVSGWYMMEDAAPYNSVDFSSNSTWDQPMIGLTHYNGVAETHTAISPSFTGSGGHPVAGKWYHFLYEFTINDPGLAKIGINLLPSNANGYNWTTDASVWFDSLGLFVNPRSHQALREGRYTHSLAAGFFDAAGKFEVTGAVPSLAGVQLEAGDRFWNPAVAAAGDVPGWHVVTTGNGATALNHCPLAVLGAAI